MIKKNKKPKVKKTKLKERKATGYFETIIKEELSKKEADRPKPRAQLKRQPDGLDLDAFMSCAQLAYLLGLSRGTLDQMRYTGRGPKYYKFTERCIRYRLGDVKDWIVGLQRKSTSQTNRDPICVVAD